MKDITWLDVTVFIIFSILCISAGMMYKAKSVSVHEREQCFTLMEEAGCIEIDWENEELIPKCMYFKESVLDENNYTLNSINRT